MRKRLLIAFMTVTAAFPALAAAHVIDARTTLSLNRSPAGSVAEGARVTFAGRIRSADPVCVRNKLVRLYEVRRGPDRAVARDRSDSDGDYRFTIRVRDDARYYARFSRSFFSSYGHSHACRSDSSPAVFVNVRG